MKPFQFFFHTVITLVMLLSFASTIAFGQDAKPEDIVGRWTAEDKKLKLEMFRSDQEYNAHLLWGDRVIEKDGVTFKLDSKNPDPALRSRSLKGIVFITGLVWNNGTYTGGSLYDGSSGRTYKCKAEIKNGKLLTRGYLGMSLFGQTMTFVRSNGTAPPAHD